jgi:hypothetical protein
MVAERCAYTPEADARRWGRPEAVMGVEERSGEELYDIEEVPDSPAIPGTSESSRQLIGTYPSPRETLSSGRLHAGLRGRLIE